MAMICFEWWRNDRANWEKLFKLPTGGLTNEVVGEAYSLHHLNGDRVFIGWNRISNERREFKSLCDAKAWVEEVLDKQE